MKTYYDLYLNVDPLLLADAFENCRKESINYFELNPAHYLYAPVYNLKLISEMKKYQFIEKMIRKRIFLSYVRVTVKLTINSENHIGTQQHISCTEMLII